MLGLDEYVNNYLKRLAGYKSTFGLDAPRKVSGNLAMPKPVTATIANWLEGTEEDQEDTDPAAVERMDRMLELA